MSCVTENDVAPVEDIITKVRGVVSTENQVNCFTIVLLKPIKYIIYLVNLQDNYLYNDKACSFILIILYLVNI